MKNVCYLLLLCVTFSFAQGRTASQKATALTAKMQAEIKFADAAKEKVYAINLDFINKASALKATEGDRREKLKALKQLDEDRARAFREIFTEQQYAAYEDFRKANRERMKQRANEDQN